MTSYPVFPLLSLLTLICLIMLTLSDFNSIGCSFTYAFHLEACFGVSAGCQVSIRITSVLIGFYLAVRDVNKTKH